MCLGMSHVEKLRPGEAYRRQAGKAAQGNDIFHRRERRRLTLLSGLARPATDAVQVTA